MKSGIAAETLVRKKRWTQEDRDAVVMLLRRAEKTMLDAHADARFKAQEAAK